MDGFVFLDKPSGFRSSDVVVQVKKVLGTRKAGHSGTLDPGATGLLLIGLDGATKYMGRLTGLDKKYEGVIKLHGDVLPGHVKGVAKEFTGEVRQMPPKRSAVARSERVKTVYALDVVSVRGREVRFRLRCEAGFYVRKLAHDFGLRLGTRAQLWKLRRTGVGPFSVSECVTLDDIKKRGDACVKSVECVMPRVK
jgi:H/ACA ribonucleoprotein complex subunit 4